MKLRQKPGGLLFKPPCTCISMN